MKIISTIKKIIITAFLTLSFIYSPYSLANNKNVMNVILDNDASSDDAMALIYLARMPNVNVEGVTVAGTGEAHGPNGASNMADLCYLLGKPNMPIAYGAPEPITNAGTPFPDFLRTLMDNLFVDKNVPKNPTPNITNSAIDLMEKILEHSDHQITIVATGPLTNIAQFIQTYPQLKNKIARIIIMGGAVKVKGNIQALRPDSNNTVAEWNIFADPKAADIVFYSGIPVTLVPLDATNQVPMTKEFYDLLSQQERPDLKLIYLLLKTIVDQFGMDAFLHEFYLWDAFAAMIAADPQLANVESMYITVDQETAQTKQLERAKDRSKIDVAMQIPNAKNILPLLFASIKNNGN